MCVGGWGSRLPHPTRKRLWKVRTWTPHLTGLHPPGPPNTQVVLSLKGLGLPPHPHPDALSPGAAPTPVLLLLPVFQLPAAPCSSPLLEGRRISLGCLA